MRIISLLLAITGAISDGTQSNETVLRPEESLLQQMNQAELMEQIVEELRQNNASSMGGAPNRKSIMLRFVLGHLGNLTKSIISDKATQRQLQNAGIPDMMIAPGAVGASPNQVLTVINPMMPMNPMNPMQPVNPMNPMQPINPMNPMQPINPMNPMQPINPMNPMQPVNPMNPMQPINPMNPMPFDQMGPPNQMFPMPPNMPPQQPIMNPMVPPMSPMDNQMFPHGRPCPQGHMCVPIPNQGMPPQGGPFPPNQQIMQPPPPFQQMPFPPNQGVPPFQQMPFPPNQVMQPPFQQMPFPPNQGVAPFQQMPFPPNQVMPPQGGGGIGPLQPPPIQTFPPPVQNFPQPGQPVMPFPPQGGGQIMQPPPMTIAQPPGQPPMTNFPPPLAIFQGPLPTGGPMLCRTPAGQMLRPGEVYPEGSFLLQCFITGQSYSLQPIGCLSAEGQPKMLGQQWEERFSANALTYGWVKECRGSFAGAQIITIGCYFSYSGMAGTINPGCFKLYPGNVYASCVGLPDGGVKTLTWDYAPPVNERAC